MPSSARKIQVDIFLFEEDCDWCLPVLFAGITGKPNMTRGAALDCFRRYYTPSSHEMIQIAAGRMAGFSLAA